MRVRWGWAILAGIVGAAAMVITLGILRAAGLTTLNLGMLLGSVFTRDFSPATWLLGFCIHLAAGATFALIYAALLEAWDGASWWQGVIISLPHVLIAGVIMWAVKFVHPLIPAEIREPGYMLANFGDVTAAAYILLHLVFGATVGAIYHEGRAHTPARTRRRRASVRPAHT